MEVIGFLMQGYTTAVTVVPTAGTGYNAFASEVEHHFYRAS